MWSLLCRVTFFPFRKSERERARACALFSPLQQQTERRKKLFFSLLNPDRWVRLLASSPCRLSVTFRKKRKNWKKDGWFSKKCGRMWWWHWAARSPSSKWKVWSNCAPRVSTLSYSASAPGNKIHLQTCSLCNRHPKKKDGDLLSKCMETRVPNGAVGSVTVLKTGSREKFVLFFFNIFFSPCYVLIALSCPRWSGPGIGHSWSTGDIETCFLFYLLMKGVGQLLVEKNRGSDTRNRMDYHKQLASYVLDAEYAAMIIQCCTYIPLCLFFLMDRPATSSIGLFPKIIILVCIFSLGRIFYVKTHNLLESHLFFYYWSRNRICPDNQELQPLTNLQLLLLVSKEIYSFDGSRTRLRNLLGLINSKRKPKETLRKFFLFLLGACHEKGIASVLRWWKLGSTGMVLFFFFKT